MPPSDAVIEKMLASILSTQDKLVTDVHEIRQVLGKIVVIEERQLNQKEALSRIGKHVDAVDAHLADAENKLHHRVNSIDERVTDLRITSAVNVARITAISAGASALITGGLLMIFKNSFGS